MGGGAKIFLGVTTISGPAVSLAGKFVSLFSSGNKVICSADSANKLLTGLNYASTGAFTVLKTKQICEEYLEANQDEIPTNKSIAFGFLLTGGSVFVVASGLGATAAFGNDQTIKQLASLLIKVPGFISDFAIDFSEEQCVELAHLIISEFVLQLNILPEIVQKMPLFIQRAYEPLSIISLVDVQQLLGDLVNVVGRQIYNRMSFLRDSRTQQDLTPSEMEGQSINTEDAFAIFFSKIKDFVFQHVADLEVMLRSQKEKGKKWDEVNAVTRYAAFQSYAARLILNTNNQYQRLVCSVCQNEVVEPDHVWQAQEKAQLISSECLANSLSTTNMAALHQGQFVLITKETDSELVQKLTDFRKKYFYALFDFLKLIKKEVLPAAVSVADDIGTTSSSSSIEPTAVHRMPMASSGQSLNDFKTVEEYVRQNEEVIHEAVQTQLPAGDEKRWINGILLRMLRSVFFKHQSAQYLLATNHPGQRYVCAFCQTEIIDTGHYWQYLSEDKDNPGFLISSECLIQAHLAANDLHAINIREQQFLRKNFVLITFEKDSSESIQLNAFKKQYFLVIKKMFRNIMFPVL